MEGIGKLCIAYTTLCRLSSRIENLVGRYTTVLGRIDESRVYTALHDTPQGELRYCVIRCIRAWQEHHPKCTKRSFTIEIICTRSRRKDYRSCTWHRLLKTSQNGAASSHPEECTRRCTASKKTIRQCTSCRRRRVSEARFVRFSRIRDVQKRTSSPDGPLSRLTFEKPSYHSPDANVNYKCCINHNSFSRTTCANDHIRAWGKLPRNGRKT
jgi:hypothetical protein